VAATDLFDTDFAETRHFLDAATRQALRRRLPVNTAAIHQQPPLRHAAADAASRRRRFVTVSPRCRQMPPRHVISPPPSCRRLLSLSSLIVTRFRLDFDATCRRHFSVAASRHDEVTRTLLRCRHAATLMLR